MNLPSIYKNYLFLKGILLVFLLFFRTAIVKFNYYLLFLLLYTMIRIVHIISIRGINIYIHILFFLLRIYPAIFILLGTYVLKS